MLSFRLAQLKPQSTDTRARLGQLTYRSKKSIETPHYVATTSRGVVPHVSQDTLRNHTAISGAYLSLEDFIEKHISHAPAFKTPAAHSDSLIRRYIAAQEDLLTILGPRRVPALHAPAHNTDSAISISTSVGFRQLGAKEYHSAVGILGPDVAITMADVITATAASAKRIQKSADRTQTWLKDALEAGLCDQPPTRPIAIFAAVPPVDNAQQLSHLQDLADGSAKLISGIALYSSNTANDLPVSLNELPRLCISDPSSPHAILTDVLLGIDLVTAPFLTAASDHGIALDFDFSSIDSKSSATLPLGYDMWSPHHQMSLQPLAPCCRCLTCTNHHRAYLHHLLQAKEMLAWTLLQIHNHAVMDRFFGAVRMSIAKGSIQEDVHSFSQRYEAMLPETTGTGPRVRGYQAKSVGGGEPKRNLKAWGRLGDAAEKIAEAQSAFATPEGDSRELEKLASQ